MFRLPQKETEISFADVVYFLRYNLKFFALLALALSTIAVAVALLLPKQYEKQLSLSVQRVPSELTESLGQQPWEDRVSRDAVGNLAVRYLQEGELGDDVSVRPSYDTVNQRVGLNLRSRDQEPLDRSGSEAVDLLKARFLEYFEDLMRPALETRLGSLERSLQGDRETLARVEQQIGQSSSTDAEVLEAQRTEVLDDIASTEIELRDLQRAQEELPQLAAETGSVEVMDESGVRQTSSLTQRIALAVLSALVVAAILTIVRGAIGKKPRA